MDIKLPKLAEGAESGVVVTVLVSEGDEIRKDQPILELETDKAVGTIPSPESGKVTKIHVKPGDKLNAGQIILTVSREGGAPAAPAREQPRAEKKARAAARPAPRSPEPPPEPEPAEEEAIEDDLESVEEGAAASGLAPPASPSIRKLAREIGLDLRKIRGTDRGGRITLSDVRTHIQKLQRAADAAASRKAAPAPSEAPSGEPRPQAAEPIDFSRWGPVEMQPLTSLRQLIGDRMLQAWTTIPHVTQFDEADITDLMALREKLAPAYEAKGARLTVTAVAIKAVCAALEKYPRVNASLDEVNHRLVLKKYCHIGIAVDTEQGLIVPVVRDADTKSVLELCLEMGQLAEKARSRKIGIEDLKGGCFTISNLGGIGGGYFTPILNKPELAILGIGRAATRPTYRGDQIVPRTALPLALSYDHRIVDGADGARFLRDIVTRLEKFPEAELQI